jgi:class 3 adenylate cyclase
MIRFAKLTDPNYDIYKSSGFPKGHPFGGQDASNLIVSDMLRSGYYVDFVELLVRINNEGYMGRQYILRGIDDVIEDVLQAGYSFDETTGQFFEDQDQQITRNWGRLLEGDERRMAVLRLDIAGNSILVKENSKQAIDRAYHNLREIITAAVVSRLGRLWSWEGDGALCVFMLGNYSRMAIFAGIQILNDMFFYNKMDNQLNSGIKLRVAVNSGDMFYSEDEIKVSKAETVRRAVSLESGAAKPNSMAISESLAMSQAQALLNILSATKTITNTSNKYRMYEISQDKN